jgi:Ni/Fe-hydrogenase subunit HybB-like protein
MTDDTDEEIALDDGSEGSGATPDIDRERVVAFLRWGALFTFAVLILVAGAGLYSSLGSIIDIWVADRYEPIARAGVNLAVLLAAIAGVVATLRRL